MSDPTPRDLVIELLRTLDEALHDYVPWTDGGGVRLMPSVYREGSYLELEAQLRQMRDSDWRSEWWHVTHRYLNGTRRIIQVSSRKTRKGRMPILPPCSELLIQGAVADRGRMTVKVYQWPAAVDLMRVELGIDRLLHTMYGGDTSRLTLPLPFLHRLMGKEVSGDYSPTTRHLSRPSLLAAQGSW